MKKRDFILIGAILSVAAILFLSFGFTRKEGAYVTVRVEGVEVARYGLDEDGEYALCGGANLLKIEDGKAFMIYADCPDHVCIDRGRISKSGETITCLPNKLTVTVGGDGGEVELIVD
jgi:hypothetical protein